LKLILIVFLLFTTIHFAQQIYLCRGFTESGEPIDIITENKLNITQSVSILFTFKNKKLEQNILFLAIEKKNSTLRNVVESKLIYPEKGKEWVSVSYKFLEEGKFEIYFSDFNRKKLASTEIQIVKHENKTETVKPDISILPNLRIIFCERIINGKPEAIIENISLRRTNGEVYIYLFNDIPLKTNKILVNIWRKKTLKSNYEEFIDSRKYEINPYWKDTFFRIWFDKSGEYKINLFDENELLIKSAYITVNI
jgi:hypothetical protein